MRAAIGMMATPTGTFSQKIHCQDAPSVTAPPTTEPIATASPLIAPRKPSAAPLRAGGTAELRMVRLSGRTSAPPAL
jgi:hypothetical protein